MIPTRVEDLDLMIAEADRQAAEVAELLARPQESLSWRPDARRWSVLGHVAHMCLVNGPYLATMVEEAARARTAGKPLSDGPYRHPWFGSWFARSMEPPPKRRLKTMRAMIPDPTLDRGGVSERFTEEQARLVVLLEESRGLDLGKIRFSSPFLFLVRLSLGSAMGLILAHNRRHLWLAREVLDSLERDGSSGAS